jgi:mono/diheme cytochrome c family protein
MKKVELLVSLFFLSFVAICAQTSTAETTLTANPIFQKNCMKCHGENAQGKFLHGPSLVSKKVNAAPMDDLRNIVTNGKGHMPKFGSKLSPEEISTLVEQVKAMNVK